MEEASLILTIRSGNLEAFASIVEIYQASILHYLFRLTGSIEVAKDLTQDTFLDAYKGIQKTKSELNLKAWLYRIATNNTRQYYRRRRLLRFIPLEFAHYPSDTSEASSGSELVDFDIQIALRGVPQEQRECLTLHFIEGFKYKEIGDILGISEDAVRMRVTRGKLAFRTLYGERRK